VSIDLRQLNQIRLNNNNNNNNKLGRRISNKFQEERQTAYLFQRLSVTVQRYNAMQSFFTTAFHQVRTSGHQ